MTAFADLLSVVFARRSKREPAPALYSDVSLSELANRLVKSTGETSALAMAQSILDGFDKLGDDGKLEFFRDLAKSMDINPDEVRKTLDAYEKQQGKSAYRAFAAAAEPARQELIRRLNRVPGATGSLVRMRADLLRLGKNEPQLEALDLDFRHLFYSWFNRGFLVLRPISWESPAHILEKIIAYEAVHAIESWEDLRRRLKPEDRRCFAFFHPAMPDEPLIFVEVALNQGIPGSVQTLLAQDREALVVDDADTAVFYSISNCQAGLASISFGNSLIKQVASDLSAELPGLRTFVTLSPIPGLARWLDQEGLDLNEEEPEQLMSLAAEYLLNAKSHNGLPSDPVARFHLGNGAIVHALQSDADLSKKGRAQSKGVMVNYLYDLSKVTENDEAFAMTGEDIASEAVSLLAAGSAQETKLKRKTSG